MGRNGKGDQTKRAIMKSQNVEQQIRERAYALYLGRTKTGGKGDDFTDWIAAEAEVLGKRKEQRC